MKIDVSLLVHDLTSIPTVVHAAERVGFAGIWTAETSHDPFLPLVLAAEHSQKLTLGTAIATSFSRSPAILAYTAWDLARYTHGRFILGLGTQVKAHNERRFGVTWEQPAGKLREVILAIRVFWDCWQNGTKLNFRGEFFKLTLMSPYFDPGPHDYPDIPIYIAAVNPQMCRLAGALAQGLHVHPLHSRRYLAEVILPQMSEGLAENNRRREEMELCSTIFVIPSDDPETARFEAEVRQQIAFYASTPTYRSIMALHGWEETALALSRLAAKKQWARMPELVDDEMLTTFAVKGSWADLPHRIKARYDGRLLDRVSYYIPYVPGERDALWEATVRGFSA
jgi:probable F420-dependent oxidoreductase